MIELVELPALVDREDGPQLIADVHAPLVPGELPGNGDPHLVRRPGGGAHRGEGRAESFGQTDDRMARLAGVEAGDGALEGCRAFVGRRRHPGTPQAPAPLMAVGRSLRLRLPRRPPAKLLGPRYAELADRPLLPRLDEAVNALAGQGRPAAERAGGLGAHAGAKVATGRRNPLRAQPCCRCDFSRITAFVCSCETRDSVTPRTSPISRRVRFS